MDIKTSNLNDKQEHQCMDAAFKVGHESHDRYLNQSFEEVESNLKQEYESVCADRRIECLPWEQARESARNAWDQAGTT